jgi:hypothetical protein
MVNNVLFADMRRYLVTDFMQTDLRAVMNTKPISHEFVQFFLYQIMVRLPPVLHRYSLLIEYLERTEIHSFSGRDSPRS